MSVTNLVFLEFISPSDWNTPKVGTYLRLATQRQSSASGYPIMFFEDIKTPSKMYLISGWDDIDAQNKYLASEGVHELTKLTEPYIKMQGVAHVSINFRDVPPDLEQVKIEKVDSSQGPASDGGWSVVGKSVGVDGVAYRLSKHQGKDVGGAEMVGRRVNVHSLPE